MLSDLKEAEFSSSSNNTEVLLDSDKLEKLENLVSLVFIYSLRKLS